MIKYTIILWGSVKDDELKDGEMRGNEKTPARKRGECSVLLRQEQERFLWWDHAAGDWLRGQKSKMHCLPAKIKSRAQEEMKADNLFYFQSHDHSAALLWLCLDSRLCSALEQLRYSLNEIHFSTASIGQMRAADCLCLPCTLHWEHIIWDPAHLNSLNNY